MSASKSPDWRNPADYPASGDEQSGPWWAWQFLRRNPEYQADYASLTAIPRVTETDEGPEESETWRTESERLCTKWSVIWIFDPTDAHRITCMPDGTPALPKRIWRSNDLKLELHQVAIQFDLRYPVDRQIEYAKGLLQELVDSQARLHAQRGTDPGLTRKKGPHQRKLPEYLRALDARQAGAEFADIAAVLYPKKSRDLSDRSGISSARTAFENGSEIMEKGYLDLLEWQ